MSAQRTRSAMLALAALSVILMAERAAAQAIVIDFSAIPIGTGLPPVAGPDNDINDFMPSGVTLASATPAFVFIGEAGGNRFLVAALTGLGADALVNLGFEAETVAVDFISTPPGQIGLIDAFSAEQSPTSLDFGSFIGETIVTNGGTASFTAPFANIRAMLIEQSGANGDPFQIDNIVITPVPPHVPAFPGLGLAVLGLSLGLLGSTTAARLRKGRGLPVA